MSCARQCHLKLSMCRKSWRRSIPKAPGKGYPCALLVVEAKQTLTRNNVDRNPATGESSSTGWHGTCGRQTCSPLLLPGVTRTKRLSSVKDSTIYRGSLTWPFLGARYRSSTTKYPFFKEIWGSRVKPLPGYCSITLLSMEAHVHLGYQSCQHVHIAWHSLVSFQQRSCLRTLSWRFLLSIPLYQIVKSRRNFCFLGLGKRSSYVSSQCYQQRQTLLNQSTKYKNPGASLHRHQEGRRGISRILIGACVSPKCKR